MIRINPNEEAKLKELGLFTGKAQTDKVLAKLFCSMGSDERNDPYEVMHRVQWATALLRTVSRTECSRRSMPETVACLDDLAMLAQDLASTHKEALSVANAGKRVAGGQGPATL